MKAKLSVMRTKGYSYPKKTNNEKIRLKLEYNEPQIPPSPSVKKALKDFIESGKLEWYPSGDCYKLRQSLAKYTGTRSEQIIVGNGSDEILKTIAFTYLSEGDEVLMPVPNYSMFRINAELAGASVIKIDDGLDFSVNSILQAISSKTKVIYISNPNSPTGKVIPKKEIIRLLDKTDCVIIIDEAYYEFYGRSVVDLVSKYENLIVTRTFSKAFSIASLRLGYAISQEVNIKELLKVKDPESVNSLAQIAGIKALENLDYVTQYIKETRKTKDRMSNNFSELGINTLPSETNFILSVFPDSVDAKDIAVNLRSQGILVRDRSKEVSNAIRITVPVIENLELLVSAVKKALNPLLIFDMDGVLVDVSKSYREAIKRTVQFFTNETIESVDIQELKNKGGFNNDWDCAYELIKRRGNEVLLEKVIEKFQEYYLGNKEIEGLIDKEIWLFDKRLLDELSQQYNLVIVTGRPREEAEYVLQKNSVIDKFSMLITMEDVSKSKPDPEGIQTVLTKFPSSKAFYFGDTIDDISAALSAGINAVGILAPGTKIEQSAVIKKAGASKVLNSINKLNEVLK